MNVSKLLKLYKMYLTLKPQVGKIVTGNLKIFFYNSLLELKYCIELLNNLLSHGESVITHFVALVDSFSFFTNYLDLTDI